jgi:hypothetical protein
LRGRISCSSVTVYQRPGGFFLDSGKKKH